jgi:hypothetical protein
MGAGRKIASARATVDPVRRLVVRCNASVVTDL